MASSGPGGAQQRRRAGPAWGKGRGTFIKGTGDGGAAQKKAEPGGVHVQRKSGEKDKKRWKSAQQINAGSAKEGQGFALWRKQKVQLEYKKLQRKQKKTTTPKDLYADNYPEHLKHLYLAEEEKLKNVERKRKPEEDITQTTEERVEEVPKKKFKNKTSIQKAKEEYKRVQNERANKRKEAEENRRQREEAKELYKKKKMEAFKVLSTKTKKGQPNFNVQMEYLLKKIQSKT
ncbi:thyroid transcription factor 1-associated protein 26 [Rana temporaria]|uniref:thyroid transcription factor 1-associated protein 26 n=1 Tax=Rana temporaria TaxID=8407 RepID=UPI001AACCDE6|nr:thyroid transcription factor 1-associated protein 26 [Rana temporaria]